MASRPRPTDALVVSMRWSGRALAGVMGLVYLIGMASEQAGGYPPGGSTRSAVTSFVLLGLALLGVLMSFGWEWLGGVLLVAVGLAFGVADMAGLYPEAGPVGLWTGFTLPFGLAGLLLMAAWWRARHV